MPSFKKMLSIAERRGYLRWMPTEPFLRYKYRRVTGRKLNLSSPTTFNEKLQKLKIIYASSPMLPEYTRMADKICAKEIIAAKVGQEYVIPTLGVWERFDDIPFDDLPEQFVLKTNHDSGGVVVCPDKSKLDVRKAKIKLEKSLKRNFYWYGREPQYKNIQPKLFAEEYLVDESGYELKDYKVFCFNGEPRLIQVDFDRFSEHKRNLYSTAWEMIDGEMNYKRDSSREIPKPEKLDEMLDLSRVLSYGIPFIRIDFYLTPDRIYFGEFTFFHGSGTVRFQPEALGIEMGKWIDLNAAIRDCQKG